jgi:glycosyltransferase involved in cell wall biosynthesis
VYCYFIHSFHMKKIESNMLSIILPVYKQEKTIKNDLIDLDLTLKRLHVPYEVIVVIDGFIDHSFEEAEKVQSPSITVIGYKENRGKGYAVRFGMAKSKGDIVGFFDSGGDISTDGIEMLLLHMRWYKADIIIGSKLHPVSKVAYPFARKILSWGYQMIIRVLFGLSIKDSQVGIKLYKRNVLEDVLPRLIVKKFAFDIEILAVAHYLGYTRIFEAPVMLDFSTASSITSTNFWKVVIVTLTDTLAVFYRLKFLHYYDSSNKHKWKFDKELNFRINIP